MSVVVVILLGFIAYCFIRIVVSSVRIGLDAGADFRRRTRRRRQD
jgi:hypothetical protein